jgi:hypothetical protein
LRHPGRSCRLLLLVRYHLLLLLLLLLVRCHLLQLLLLVRRRHPLLHRPAAQHSRTAQHST